MKIFIVQFQLSGESMFLAISSAVHPAGSGLSQSPMLGFVWCLPFPDPNNLKTPRIESYLISSGSVRSVDTGPIWTIILKIYITMSPPKRKRIWMTTDSPSEPPSIAASYSSFDTFDVKVLPSLTPSGTETSQRHCFVQQLALSFSTDGISTHCAALDRQQVSKFKDLAKASTSSKLRGTLSIRGFTFPN